MIQEVDDPKDCAQFQVGAVQRCIASDHVTTNSVYREECNQLTHTHDEAKALDVVAAVLVFCRSLGMLFESKLAKAQISEHCPEEIAGGHRVLAIERRDRDACLSELCVGRQANPITNFDLVVESERHQDITDTTRVVSFDVSKLLLYAGLVDGESTPPTLYESVGGEACPLHLGTSILFQQG